MKNKQCFSCYEQTMFQIYGQTKSYNPHKIQMDYIIWLPIDNKVHCVMCGRKVEYNQNEQNVWIETEI
jgi:hypothetical protein